MISIHALREEGDALSVSLTSCRLLFLSTPSARRATPPGPPPATRRRHFYPRPPRGGRPGAGEPGCGHDGISIHALREEGDYWDNYNQNLEKLFLSTPSARRATGRAGKPVFRAGKISIHALREEGDDPRCD